MKKLLLIGGSNYPSNTAMSNRYHALAKLFQAAGCEVLIVTKGEKNGGQIKEYDGVPYLSVSGKITNRLIRAFDLLMRIPHTAKRLIREQQFDGILMTTRISGILRLIKKYSPKGVEAYYDATEWYSPCEFKNGEKALAYRMKNRLIEKEINGLLKVISISSYFEKYFQSRNIATARIPAILDVEKVLFVPKKGDSNKTVVMYAGSPGRKDYLKEVVEACASLTGVEREKLEIRLLGLTKEFLVTQCGATQAALDMAGDAIKCMGRVPHERVLEELQKAHFTILIRPHDERYAKAGFPTKVPESLATGTPVICNLTSDLGMYLRDGKNAIVLASENVEDVVIGLRRAINLSSEEKEKMSVMARKTAEESFDYRKNVVSLIKLFDS